MEQCMGRDAHKRFSVFVAVNDKGQAGEALRVAHDRQLVNRSAFKVWSPVCRSAIRSRPSDGWA